MSIAMIASLVVGTISPLGGWAEPPAAMMQDGTRGLNNFAGFSSLSTPLAAGEELCDASYSTPCLENLTPQLALLSDCALQGVSETCSPSGASAVHFPKSP
jgi:hypothetical protein